MISITRKVISGAALSFAATTASAAFIDNSTYLTDTSSGLDWLDVTASVNMSYNYVSSQFGAGGEFEGWRYATGDEFNALLSGYTGVANNGYDRTDVSNDSVVDSLVQILGDTLQTYYLSISLDPHLNCGSYGCHTTYTTGFLADVPAGIYSQPVHYLGLIYDRPESLSGFDSYKARYQYVGDEYATYKIGSYLVRDTVTSEVSEPGAIALLALSLAVLGLARGRF